VIKSPWNSPKKSELIAEYLAQRIGCGDLPPGTVLEPIRAAAREFDASATVIREARKQLDDAGLIAFSRSVLAVVRASEHWRWDHHLGRIALRELPGYPIALRDYMTQEIALERLGAGCGALDPCRRGFAVLVAARDAFERAVLTGSPYEIELADLTFHQALVALIGNAAKESFGRLAQEVLCDESQRWRRTPEDRRCDVREHAAIVHAIATREPGEASALVPEHWNGMRQRYAKH
jgi:DNA-binding FadR family transcriptional regulator